MADQHRRHELASRYRRERKLYQRDVRQRVHRRFAPRPRGNALVNGTGSPIAGVTTDYDGDLRSLTAPSIGADEVAVTNTAPTAVILTPNSASLAENTSTASAIELSTITITDDAFGTNTRYLSGADMNSFEIVDGKLRLKAGVALDFETKSSYSVRVNVDDTTVGGTPDAFADFTLNITDIADAPQLVSVVVNGGDTFLNAAQRSQVTSLVVTFSARWSSEPIHFRSSTTA